MGLGFFESSARQVLSLVKVEVVWCDEEGDGREEELVQQPNLRFLGLVRARIGHEHDCTRPERLDLFL